MNLIIHTQELNDLDYNPYFVSPKIHSKHHNGTNIRNTYSALHLIWSICMILYQKIVNKYLEYKKYIIYIL